MTIIYYVYPQHHDVSFKFVALEHIKALKSKYIVYEIPSLNFYMFTPMKSPVSIIHPFWYSMWRWREEEFSFFEMYRRKCKYIIGVEVADTDKIAEKYVNYANNYSDAFIGNSDWTINVFKNSGIKIPVYKIPHNFNSRLLAKDEELKIDQQILEIEKLKKEKKIKLIMISLWHSDYRKGADIFHEVAREVQKERNDVYFLVKSGAPRVDFQDLRMINISGVVPFDDMVKMYRISDLYFLPSRGGSFELNGLEAFISGIPTVATKEGAWAEYFPPSLQDLLIDVEKRPKIFQDNDIHIGNGVEMNKEKAIEKILDVLDNIDEYKEKVRENKRFWLENYSFDAMKKTILKIMEKYEK
ncbi:glycosyltransferase [Stygiolobus rod-shaped virus]|uniref:Glycosyl transferase family 1 domain-containing protein n=1 Tax=Stygiolobus rod-shaped virus TaxID=537009 RepID=B6EFD8_9VIRU|nr:glycosyltransferase [Stygiolobus rod-shaped virus]CAQ58473.1 hypothetical protein [Stygiolobus rod-shaped virus]